MAAVFKECENCHRMLRWVQKMSSPDNGRHVVDVGHFECRSCDQ